MDNDVIMNSYRTGKDWCDLFQVSIVKNLKLGFDHINLFTTEKMSRQDFYEKLAKCEIIYPVSITRRKVLFRNIQDIKKLSGSEPNPTGNKSNPTENKDTKDSELFYGE